MPYITLEEHLPGITGLLEYRQAPAGPIRKLTQQLLRGSSTLTEGERELIATVVSHENACTFCTTAHAATAGLLVGDKELVEKIKENVDAAPLSDKMKALLTIAKQVQKSGKSVTKQNIEKAKSAGATDVEIHDTVLIAALFCLYNRYVDGLSTVAPSDPRFYEGLASRLVNNGYNRLPGGYDHLKQTNKNQNNE